MYTVMEYIMQNVQTTMKIIFHIHTDHVCIIIISETILNLITSFNEKKLRCIYKFKRKIFIGKLKSVVIRNVKKIQGSPDKQYHSLHFS